MIDSLRHFARWVKGMAQHHGKKHNHEGSPDVHILDRFAMALDVLRGCDVTMTFFSDVSERQTQMFLEQLAERQQTIEKIAPLN